MPPWGVSPPSPCTQIAGLDNIPFGWVGDPQSLLLNGKGQYNCSLIPSNFTAATGDVKTCNASAPQCGREVFTVQAGKTYRFRIASIAALNALAFAVKGHPLIVVAADGYLVKPFKLKSLDVYSGQTVDVLLRANQVGEDGRTGGKEGVPLRDGRTNRGSTEKREIEGHGMTPLGSCHAATRLPTGPSGSRGAGNEGSGGIC